MNGVFAVDKPSGVSSAKCIAQLQAIFSKSDNFAADLEAARQKTAHDMSSNKHWSDSKKAAKLAAMKVKIGHGGTLDPLASGILIVGVGLGTKKLQNYLNNSTKTYETEALLGMSTTTGDCEGEILTKNPIDHITVEMVKGLPEKFTGDLEQTPPIFSALKLNGKPLYEYARRGIPLPAPIKSRKVKVHSYKLFDEILTTNHNYQKLESQFDEDGKPVENLLANNPTLNDSPLNFSDQYLENHPEEKNPAKPLYFNEGEDLPEKLPLIKFSASVSSGTYIRSLISDAGRALQSSAYMVSLIRSEQGEWDLNKNVFSFSDFKRDERIWGPILKKVLNNGPDINVNEQLEELTKQLTPILEKERESKKKEEQKQEEEQNQEFKEQEESEKSEINETNDLPKKRSIDDVEK